MFKARKNRKELKRARAFMIRSTESLSLKVKEIWSQDRSNTPYLTSHMLSTKTISRSLVSLIDQTIDSSLLKKPMRYKNITSYSLMRKDQNKDLRNWFKSPNILKCKSILEPNNLGGEREELKPILKSSWLLEIWYISTVRIRLFL